MAVQVKDTVIVDDLENGSGAPGTAARVGRLCPKSHLDAGAQAMQLDVQSRIECRAPGRDLKAGARILGYQGHV